MYETVRIILVAILILDRSLKAKFSCVLYSETDRILHRITAEVDKFDIQPSLPSEHIRKRIQQLSFTGQPVFINHFEFRR